MGFSRGAKILGKYKTKLGRAVDVSCPGPVLFHVVNQSVTRAK
jgi:DUF438 domain-containing protein